MAKFYFTFGSCETHAHPGCVQPIIAEDYGSARQAMFQEYGDKWAFSYTEEEWEAAKLRASKMAMPFELELEPIDATGRFAEATDGRT